MQDEKRLQWDLLRSKNCNDSFTADACGIFFHVRAVLNTKKNMKKENMECLGKNFDALKCRVFVARHTAVTNF